LSDPCVVIGCGSHSASVISIIESVGCYEIIGLIDVAEHYDLDEQKSGYKVIFNLDELLNNPDKYQHLNCFIAIGDGGIRRSVYENLKKLKFKLPNVVSNNAFIDRTVDIGDGNVIAHRVIINAQVKLGSNNLINTGSIIEHHCHIKSHIHIAPGAVICGGVAVSDLAFIGAGSVIIPHISVAENSILGAGSVLVTNIESKKITFVGIPAKAQIK